MSCWSFWFRSISFICLFISLASYGQTVPAAAGNYLVVNTYPHDTKAFTEGLLFYNGFLYESTGLYGHSSLRKVDLKTGNVLQQVGLDDQYFGEGLTLLDGNLYQLTWKNKTGFVYDLNSFKEERRFSYTYEGWGMTTDGKSLIVSDGSDKLRFVDPATFDVRRIVDVTENGNSVTNLNELEYVKGQIYANIWRTFYIVRIDPISGKIVHYYDMSNLWPKVDSSVPIDVLNGIAYDPKTDRVFITGKFWPKIFEVRFYP